MLKDVTLLLKALLLLEISMRLVYVAFWVRSCLSWLQHLRLPSVMHLYTFVRRFYVTIRSVKDSSVCLMYHSDKQ